MDNEQFSRIKDQLQFDRSIIGIGEYFQSAVLVPLILVDGEYHFVFEKRASGIRQGGEVCFPGGKIDEGDISSLAAALRETEEELGIEVSDIEILGELDTLMLPTGVLVYPHLGVIQSQLDPKKVAEVEVAEVFTVPVSYFMETKPELYQCQILIHPYLNGENGEKQVLLPAEELGLPELYSEPWGNAQQSIYVYKAAKATVWGLTARILYECVQMFKKATISK